MQLFENFWLWLVLFLFSFTAILYYKKKAKETVQAQFVVTTGCLIFAFYLVCFLSGVCTIINFIRNYFF